LRVFVFAHVITMFGAVALSGGVDHLLLRIASTGDVQAIRGAFSAYKRFSRFVPMLFITGLVFGLTAMVVERFNPFAPWLLMAYVLFAAGVLIGALAIGRWSERLAEAAHAAPDDGSPAFRAIAQDPAPRRAHLAFWAVIAAIVFVMVVKPLG
jgi:hypothetical protein